MNIPMIRYILCQVMRIEGVLMLLPSLISIIYGDGEGLYYGIVAGVLIFYNVLDLTLLASTGKKLLGLLFPSSCGGSKAIILNAFTGPLFL